LLLSEIVDLCDVRVVDLGGEGGFTAEASFETRVRVSELRSQDLECHLSPLQRPLPRPIDSPHPPLAEQGHEFKATQAGSGFQAWTLDTEPTTRTCRLEPLLVSPRFAHGLADFCLAPRVLTKKFRDRFAVASI